MKEFVRKVDGSKRYFCTQGQIGLMVDVEHSDKDFVGKKNVFGPFEIWGESEVFDGLFRHAKDFESLLLPSPVKIEFSIVSFIDFHQNLVPLYLSYWLRTENIIDFGWRPKLTMLPDRRYSLDIQI